MAAQSGARRGAARFVCGIIYLGAFGFVLGNLWMELRARGRVFKDVGAVPANEVGLVLGTSRWLPGGSENPFFAGRIAAAAELYRAGKVRHFILSGDNSDARYDEPASMRAALREQGVPESATTADDAGFRTLDSFARAKQVFATSKLTIVTDDFHAARSILLARHFGIDAVLFTSKPVPLKWSMKTRSREIAARCRALLDIYVLETGPRFLSRTLQVRER
ncbi:MAG: YdcF family protein [Verrucomicrobiota bacterium]|nr:YdcF family protein [Verrucomicrobiota bacterium]